MKIQFSEEGHLLARDIGLKEKNSILDQDLNLGQVRVHDRINVLDPSSLTSGPTDCVVIMSYEGMHTRTLE